MVIIVIDGQRATHCPKIVPETVLAADRLRTRNRRGTGHFNLPT